MLPYVPNLETIDIGVIYSVPKYQIFLDQNIFLRYGHIALGVLKTCKEVMKNEILRSISLFKR